GKGARLEPVHLLPGRNVFELNTVAGVRDFEQHRWIREHLDPVRHFGHTHLLFEVDEATYSQFLEDTRRHRSTEEDERECPPDGAYHPVPLGTDQPWSIAPGPGPRRWRICVSTHKGADFGLQSLPVEGTGRLRFGLEAGGGC